MEEFLLILRERINSISEFINRLQIAIGLSDANDNSINGKINKLLSTVNSMEVQQYHVEKLVIQDNFFLTTYVPSNGMCVNDEITLYHPDGGTLLWEGIDFNGNQGIH